MLVSDAPLGASFKVKRVLLGREVGKRLADMGFTEGAEGEVVRGGFLRGPLQVRIRGYDILLRRSEAAAIEIEAVGDWSTLSDALREGFWSPGRRHGQGGQGGRGGYRRGRASGAFEGDRE